jgi:hypothetical protein
MEETNVRSRKIQALVEAVEAHHVQISNVVTCAFTQHLL